jgi:exodeoxyribonuclease V alpha subunit
MKNNYDILTPEGDSAPIFNGNIGYIKQITERHMVINLTEQGDIILKKEDWNNMQLGYAITVHKKQGDSSPYIIIGFDTSAYALYSKELLYTAITRARMKCILVTQNKAFRQAITITGSNKQTWLKEMLNKELREDIEKTI